MEQNLFGNKPVLVTGASGMVGSHLILALLAKGIGVRAFVRNQNSKSKTLELFKIISQNIINESSVEWVYGDITNYEDVMEAMQNVEYVFHCAGVVSFSKNDSDELFRVNIEGTKHVVNAALECGIIKLCHVSSVAAIGKAEANNLVDESCEFQESKRTSPYHFSKFMGEMEVWRGIAEGLSAVIVNPSVIIGAGDWNKSSCAIFGTVAKGLSYYSPGITGYVSVNDLVDCMILLMQNPISGQRYIISAENIDYKTLFYTIAKAVGTEPPTKCIKLWQIKLVVCILQFASIFTRKSPKITKHTAKTAFSKTYYSNKKITEAIPFTFRSIHNEIMEVGKIYRTQVLLRKN